MPSPLRALPALWNLGLAILVGGIWLALPERLEAQSHGVSIFKTCVSPKTSCNSAADCPDPNSCTGLGICSSSGANHMTECSITLTNSDPSLDDIRVISASDRIFAAAGEVIVPDLPIASTTGTVSGDCTGTIDPAIGCTLDPGASVTFISNTYVIQPGDPDPLLDQGQVTVQDLCNVNPTGCSTSPSLAQFGASTDLISGCLPGPTCTPTATSTPTNTPTGTPPNTPINTPTNTATVTTTAPPGEPPAEVPTLSFPMLALLGLMLAGAGLFLARRS